MLRLLFSKRMKLLSTITTYTTTGHLLVLICYSILISISLFNSIGETKKSNISENTIGRNMKF